MSLKRRDFMALGTAAGAFLALNKDPFEFLFGPPRHYMERAQERLDTPAAIRKAIPSTCMQCYSSCGIMCHVEDGRLVKIEGNPQHPHNRGKVCAKGLSGLNKLYDPDRILYPMRRVGKRGEGRWKRISWDEALTEVAGKLREIREIPEEFVLHCGLDRTQGFVRRFANAFGTPSFVQNYSLGKVNKFVAQELTWGHSMEVPDLVRTKYILNFGCNVYEASMFYIPMVQRVVQARVDNVAKMVTFDVRLANAAGRSDEWILVKPGTDGIIALAMAYVIMEEGLYDRDFVENWMNMSPRRLKVILSRYTPEKAEQASGVRAQDIVRIAREFAETKPATVISMRGISSHLNGVYAERAIMLLPAITGNIDVLGGYCVPRMAKLAEPSPIPPEPTRTSGVARREDLTLAVHTISQEVFPLIKEKKQRVGVYMTYVHNPAYSGPEADLVESVLKDESLVPFFVSVDAFLSETTAMADIILPDALYLERWDPETQPALELVPYVGLRQPVLPPMGEARSFREVAYDLAHRVGGGMEKYFRYGSPENYIKWAISDIEGLKAAGGLDYLKKYGVWTDRTAKRAYKLHEQELSPSELAGSRVLREGVIVKKDPSTGGEVPIGLRLKGKSVRGFPTPSRKFEVYSQKLLNAKTLNRSKRHSEVYVIGARVNRHFPHPYYEPIWEHFHMSPNEFVLVTYKPNVQTNSSTANCKWLSEIHHSNPMWVHEDSARALGIRNGDFVEVSSKVGKIVTQALVMQGIHPRVVAISTGVGRWAYGRIAQGKPFQSADPDTRHIWWEEEGKGVHPNPIIPVATDPIGGGQAFMDTVVALRPLRSGELRQKFRREGW